MFSNCSFFASSGSIDREATGALLLAPDAAVEAVACTGGALAPLGKGGGGGGPPLPFLGGAGGGGGFFNIGGGGGGGGTPPPPGAPF